MADITFVSAPIGGGKSLYATRAICKELSRSDRMIVTNVPIYMEPTPGKLCLQEWAHEYIGEPVDVRKRVRVLNYEQTFEFWRYLPGNITVPMTERPRRGSEKDLELIPDLDWRKLRQESGEIPNGCFFLIDEVHLHFAARDWGKVGGSVEHYMSQLRKLNDDLWLITQHPDKVDKNFRRNATEWLMVRNMSKTRLFAGVALRGRFQWAVYPQQPIRGEKPTQGGWFRLEDQRFQDVYDTMAGVGLSGKLAPESSRWKGHHWSMWLLVMACIVAVAIFVPRFLMGLVGNTVGAGLAGLQKGVTKHMGLGPKPELHGVTPVIAPMNPGQSAPLSVFEMPRPQQAKLETSKEIGMTGWFRKDGVCYVGLSNGRVVTSNDPRLTVLNQDGCVFDNVYYEASMMPINPNVYEPGPKTNMVSNARITKTAKLTVKDGAAASP